MGRHGGIERFVFFRCNDCNIAFWKNPLRAPREHIVQHLCFENKISTRKFGSQSRTCKRKHPGVACVVKITEAEYKATEPNCGSYERYLANPRSMGKKRRTILRAKKKTHTTHKKLKSRRKKKETPIAMSAAVRNILIQNELIQSRKKRKQHVKSSSAKCVWDPGYSDEGSKDEFKVPPRATRLRLSSDPNDFLVRDSFSKDNEPNPAVFDSAQIMSSIEFRKPFTSPVTSRRHSPALQQRKYALPCLPSLMKKPPSIPLPSPIASDTESDSTFGRAPTILTIDDLIAHGVSANEDGANFLANEEQDILSDRLGII